MKMIRLLVALSAFILSAALLGGCRDEAKPAAALSPAAQEENLNREEKTMTLSIGATKVTVDWENNEAVQELQNLATAQPLTLQLSMYGGFEQVGDLGHILPHNDVRLTTQAGDIVLYSGDHIVIFYGSNTWAYTRLGHINDKSPAEMRELLSKGDVKITIAAD